MVTSSASRVISALRLPLMVGVIFMHSKLSSEGTPILDCLVKIFTLILPKFCVPLFLVFSGYLFFGTSNTFTRTDYIRKIKKRGRTLLIPYMIWNFFTIVVFWCIHHFTPSLINPDFENIAIFSPQRLLNCFWKGSGGLPIAYQFWFIRDLMIIMLLSPIVYGLVRKTPIGIIILTFVYFLSSHFTVLYFFSLGAYFALQNIDFVSQVRKILKYAAIIATITFIIRVVNDSIIVVEKIYILSSMVSAIALTDKYIDKIILPKYVTDSSFFLFCYHNLPILFLIKIGSGILSGRSEVLWIVDFFLNPLIVIILGILLYKVLSKSMPRFLSIITGGR